MIDVLYQSDDFGYHYIEETSDFILSTKKYKIRITLKGKDALLFRQHLVTITSEPDENMNRRIERAIGISLYMYICKALEQENLEK